MKFAFRSRKIAFPRKYLLPLIIILFILMALSLAVWKRSEINFDLIVPPKEEMINPLPSPTTKEKLDNLLKQNGLTPTNLNFQDKQVEGSFSGNLTVFFSLEKDLPSQVVSLQFILTRAKIEGKLPKIVDLRFQKPVVSY